MVYIATVHWRTGKWINIQQAYLRRYIHVPYRVYAFLDSKASTRLSQFHYSCIEPIREHAVKLNLLADKICRSAESDDDILIFIDGDAFPIANLEPFFEQKLTAYKLAAVQRLENNGDIQPHPCFCATTVGFWREIKGDWRKGYKWKTLKGNWVTDVGGNLLKQLKDNKIEWYRLLRSNKHNPHGVMFGIYDYLIYHHGAGFRNPITRLDIVNVLANPCNKSFATSTDWRRVRETNKLISDKIFSRIVKSSDFVTEFI